MPVKVTSNKEKDYLLIKATGIISSTEEWTHLPAQYYDRVKKHQATKIIINVMDLVFPADILSQCILVDTYTTELPVHIRKLKVALVADKRQKDAIRFWETYGQNRGYESYRAFFSMDEAEEFIKD